MNTVTGRAALAVATITIGGGLAACGGDDKGTGAAKPPAAAPESRIAPAADVSAGLRRMVAIAGQVASTPDAARSKAASAQLEPIWKRIEGTIKRDAPNLYVTVEDSLALLGSGDAGKTKEGARMMAGAASAYLAKHPG